MHSHSMLTDLSTRVTLEKPVQGIHDPQYINANFVSVAAAALLYILMTHA